MKVTVKKITQAELVNHACSFTTHKPSSIDLRKIYRCEHSPMRTQLFMIDCVDVPTFVVNHFTRHKIGFEPWVQSNRPDRNGGNKNIDRNTLINFCFMANAQSLVNIARKRLCAKASSETRELMQLIKNEILLVDNALYEFLVPEIPKSRPLFRSAVTLVNTGTIYIRYSTV